MNSTVKYQQINNIDCKLNGLSLAIQNLISALLSISLIVKIFRGSMFTSITMPGSIVYIIFAYIDAALNYFASYLTIPLLIISFLSTYKTNIRKLDLSVLVLVVFVLYALIHIFIGSSEFISKRLEMFSDVAIIALIALQLRMRNDIIIFWNGLIIVGIIFVALSLISGQFISIITGNGIVNSEYKGSGRIDLGMDTISAASYVYQCALACVAYLMLKVNRSTKSIYLIPVIFVLIIIGVLTGSKGPLVSFIVSVFVLIFLGRYASNKFLITLIILIGIYYIIPFLLIYKGAIDHILVGGDDFIRREWYYYIINSSPSVIGNGVGSFAKLFGLSAINGGYPHNSLLETYYEIGIIGLILLLYLLIKYTITLIYNSKYDYVQQFILSYFCYAVTLSLFSGSIFGDSLLWMGFAFTDNNVINKNQL